MLAAALLTVISFHNLFVGTMLCFLVSAAPAGLLAISLAVSAAGSMVIVNTVVLVKARFGLGEIEVAWRWRFGCGRPATRRTWPMTIRTCRRITPTCVSTRIRADTIIR